jgi:hypothetical protein
MHWWTSLTEYTHRGVRHGFAILVGGVGGVLGLVSLAVNIPAWIWGTLLAVGVVYAQWQTFDDVRRERDAARKELQARLSDVRFGLVLEGLDLGIDVATAGPPPMLCNIQVSLILGNGVLEPIEYVIESIDLQIADLTAADPQFLTHGGRILPGRTQHFRHPTIEGISLTESRAPIAGELTFVARYSHAAGGPSFRQRRSIALTITTSLGSDLPTGVSWLDTAPPSDDPEAAT